MCLRYALKMLQNNEFESAKKYLYLSVVFKERITEDARYKDLWKLIKLEGADDFAEELHAFERNNILIRTTSYDPPEGFVEID